MINCQKASEKAGLNKSELENLSLIAREAVGLGSKVLNKYYGNIRTVENKGNIGDLVTNADLEAEETIVEYLNLRTKDIGILAEEGGEIGEQSKLYWCIDPLDGTTNFAHGYPFFGTSIGLIWEKQPILGAISVPRLNETYWAAPMLGAHCNHKEISVSITNKLIESLLVTGFAYDRLKTNDNNYAEFCSLTNKTRGVRRSGAAAIDLAFLAAGRVDGYWEKGLQRWDLAAGVAIVELAGGVVTDYKSNTFDITTGRVLAVTPGIEMELKKELYNIKPMDTKLMESK